MSKIYIKSSKQVGAEDDEQNISLVCLEWKKTLMKCNWCKNWMTKWNHNQNFHNNLHLLTYMKIPTCLWAVRAVREILALSELKECRVTAWDRKTYLDSKDFQEWKWLELRVHLAEAGNRNTNSWFFYGVFQQTDVYFPCINFIGDLKGLISNWINDITTEVFYKMFGKMSTITFKISFYTDLQLFYNEKCTYIDTFFPILGIIHQSCVLCWPYECWKPLK